MRGFRFSSQVNVNTYVFIAIIVLALITIYLTLRNPNRSSFGATYNVIVYKPKDYTGTHFEISTTTGGSRYTPQVGVGTPFTVNSNEYIVLWYPSEIAAPKSEIYPTQLKPGVTNYIIVDKKGIGRYTIQQDDPDAPPPGYTIRFINVSDTSIWVNDTLCVKQATKGVGYSGESNTTTFNITSDGKINLFKNTVKNVKSGGKVIGQTNNKSNLIGTITPDTKWVNNKDGKINTITYRYINNYNVKNDK